MPATSRPGSVTIVVVLTWINAILQILFGVFLLIAGVAVGAAPSSAGGRAAGGVLLIGIGIVYLIIGLVTAFVASRLGRGGRGSRMLLTVIQVITIVVNVVAWISAQTTQVTVQSVIAIIVAVVILALLWNRRANEFFS